MSNHNYSQYSNKKVSNKLKTEETIMQTNIVDEVVDAKVVAPVESVVKPVEPVEVKMESVESKVEPEVKPETKPEPQVITGIVANCSKLNVRVKPAKDAEVLTILDAKTEVVIDPARSTNEWFKIATASGVDGFCMRKFVSVKL